MKKAAKVLVFLTIAILAISVCALAGPVPDTGQTGDYTATFGEDSDYNINPQSYTKLDASGSDLPDDATSWVMVRDNVTGLIWEAKQNKDDTPDFANPNDADNTYTWYDKNPETNGGDAGSYGDGKNTGAFIQALNDANFGGHSDWRMPTAKELASIANSETYNPAINTGYFPNTVSSYYWSSTTDAYSTVNAWSVWYINGRGISIGKSSSNYVRAVRGEQFGSLDNLIINGDGTVTDTSTGLMWEQKTDDDTANDKDNSYRWEDALAWVESLNNSNYLGYNDWRLPNKNELQSLVNYSVNYPSIDSAAFPGTKSGYYWSSTTYGSTYAWTVVFTQGSVYYDNKSYDHFVRAVRGGQNQLLDHLVILTPEQGDRWEVGSRQAITWETLGIPGSVAISISKDGGKTYETINDSTPNDGSHDWTVSGSISPNCVVKIEPLTDTSKSTTQGFFTIAVWHQAKPLPDTGQTICYDADGTIIDPCPSPVEPFCGQDANHNINPPSYTKLDASGNDLPDDATSWAMVRDNVTKLIWEVKQNKDDLPDDANPHDADNKYTWYDSNPETNGGVAGTSGDGTDTEDFIQALNDANFGGHSDWRMPTAKELASIANSEVLDPAINTGYFPNTMLSYYSTSTTFAGSTYNA